jgi:hypothetical protein
MVKPLFQAPWPRLLLVLHVLSSVVGGTSLARAEELSEFEHEVLTGVLTERSEVLDEAPGHKWIESIECVVIEPFDERDPVPDLVNVLHVSSLERVVKQELALKEGDRFDRDRFDDSLQNLRATNRFSLVLVATVRGSAPDRLRLLVITKDIWSLRLNWNIEIVNNRVNVLLLAPSEVNLFGTHSTIGGLYLLEPDRHTVGGTFYDPHIGGSDIALFAYGGVILQRESFDEEGSFGFFEYYKPRKSRYSRWAWSVGMGWREEVTRRYLGDQILQIAIIEPDGSTTIVPEIFETDRLAGEYQLTRSFGITNKTNLSFGVEADQRRYRAPQFAELSPAGQSAFERAVVPTSDMRVSPFAQVAAYSTKFQRLLNVETLSLQEDLSLGHNALLRVYPASSALGSSRSLLGVMWGFAYSVPLGTGLARAKAGATIELARDNQNDVEFNGGLRLFSPSLGFGRFHFDGLALDRYRNYLNVGDYVLGGQNRLRGYDYNQFQGTKLVALNLEFRSIPIELFGVHVGAVAFYDLGDADDSYDALSLKQSLGTGLRFLLPQFDRTTFRFDVGFPLDRRHDAGFPGGFVIEFGQAFALPTVEEPSVLDGVLPTY